ncbi:MFS transporter [Nibricoccus aquaticus]|uniref:MFS transporter n=1 Tax=Nibricoccus aquaticus TaxID=2576891 RepID=UPI001FEAB4D3|nr:MFS transporter [Nibricoccus aquaticus]
MLTYLCYGAMMSLAIGLNLLPVFLTTLSELFGGADGLTQEQLGRLGAIAFLGLAVGIVLTGPLADRWGAKPFAQLGNAMIAGSLTGMAFAPTYTTLGIWMFTLGLGAGILDMVLSPVVAALNPERRAVAMNWLHSFYCVGAVVTILAGSLALRAGLGWRGSCLVLLPLPVGLLVVFASQRFPAMTSEGGRTPMSALMKRGWFVAALVAIFLGGATELGMAQWLPAYAERSLGFSQWTASMALLAFSVAMALGRMVIGAIGGKWNSFQIMAWGCGLTVVLFIAGSFLPSPVWALVACVAAGFTGSCLWPTMLAVTADRYPDGGASMFGALAALGNAGGIFMPWLVGFIADRSDLHWGLAISAVAPLVMMPLVMWLGRSVRAGGRG